MKEKKFYTVKESLKFLRLYKKDLSIWTVYSYIRTGILRVKRKKIGRKVRILIPAEEIERFLEERKELCDQK